MAIRTYGAFCNPYSELAFKRLVPVLAEKTDEGKTQSKPKKKKKKLYRVVILHVFPIFNTQPKREDL